MRAAAIAAALTLTLVASSASAAEAKGVGGEAPNDDEPPPPPYAKGLVVDAHIGALGFLSQFKKLAPPGPWFHAQVGYEIFSWLMVMGEGELVFTDTSNTDKPPRVRSFPMFGFGGGARFTWHITDRVAIYGQPALGMMKADVATNELGLHGFKDAESLALWLGFRAGVELYQIDRHFALGLTTAIRTASGFAKISGQSDTGLALDGGLSLRYAF